MLYFLAYTDMNDFSDNTLDRESLNFIVVNVIANSFQRTEITFCLSDS